MRETTRTGRPRDATRRFAAVIRACLTERNQTVRDAAVAAGLPVRSVQNVLDGRSPTIDRAAEICDALDLELYIGPPQAAAAGDHETLAETIREALSRRGTTPFRAAEDAGLPQDAVQRVLDGHPPRAGRLAAICDALGLEFYVGPPRGPSAPAAAAALLVEARALAVRAARLQELVEDLDQRDGQ